MHFSTDFDISWVFSERPPLSLEPRPAREKHDTMEELSDDVLSMILLHLSTLECVASAGFVSKRWHKATLAISERLWAQLATSTKITQAVSGGVLDLCGVGWKSRHLMLLPHSRVPHTATELNNAFEFYIELGNESFLMAELGACDLTGNRLGADDDGNADDDDYFFGAPRRISVKARVVTRVVEDDIDGDGSAIFENIEGIAFGFEPCMHTVFARRRADGAVARVFRTANDDPEFLYDENDPKRDCFYDEKAGTLIHSLRGGETLCAGARDGQGGGTNELMTSASFEIHCATRSQTRSGRPNWAVPFKQGEFKLRFSWQHYYGHEAVGFDNISPSVIWDALNPLPERGPFFM